MKFALVTILGAFLCATIASAAPSSLSVSASSVFKNAYANVMVYRSNRECIVEVLNDAFAQTKLHGLWNGFVSKMSELVANWKKLQTIEDKTNQIKYKTVTFANALNVMSFEVPNLVQELESLKLLNTVRSAVSTKCLGKSDDFDLLADADYLTLWKSLSDVSAQVIEVFGDLSAKANLESWSESRTELQQQFEKLNECINGSEVDVCSIREGIKFFKLAADFGRIAMNEPKVLSVLVESA